MIDDEVDCFIYMITGDSFFDGMGNILHVENVYSLSNFLSCDFSVFFFLGGGCLRRVNPLRIWLGRISRFEVGGGRKGPCFPCCSDMLCIMYILILRTEQYWVFLVISRACAKK